MIELPESITLGKQANEILTGKTITSVFNATKPHKFAFFNGDPEEYKPLLTGKKVKSARGFGMYVDIYLEDDTTISIGDGVTWKYGKDGTKIPDNYQLLLGFDDNSFLAFGIAMYGMIYAFKGEFDNKYYRLSADSISPLNDQYTEKEFNKLFSDAKKSLSAKALLATEQRIPGVGNGVAQDILFNARINPKRKALSLSDKERKDLFNSLKKTLKEMTDKGGRDTQTDIFGNKGGYKTILSANTWKNPCPVCGDTIIKESFLGGTIYYCPTCQPL